jgi:hypothetical protein
MEPLRNPSPLATHDRKLVIRHVPPQPDREFEQVPGDPWLTDAIGTRLALLGNPATIRLRSEDAYRVRSGVVELLADRQQPSAVVRARDGPVAAELAAEKLDLGVPEANASVASSGTAFKEKLPSDVESAQYGPLNSE